MHEADGERNGLTRRTFVKGLAASTALAATGPAAVTAESKPQGDLQSMEPIKHLLLFIHTPVTYSYRQLLRPAPEITKKYLRILEEKAPEKSTAVCVLQGGKGDKPLVQAAQKHFGDRCIVDPDDGSEPTLALLTKDLNRALGKRGNHGEWNIYEIWSSNNARRWTEAIKMQLAKRGLSYNPQSLSMEAFGSWSGCHHKYANFMACYLGMTKPAHIHAEMDLCTLKGLPMDAGEFVEERVLDRHVVLVLFRRTDGCPMAQFWDGLRPVWERPHTATVSIAPGSVELINLLPNSYLERNGIARKLGDGFIADVGDGCRPAYTTVIGRSAKTADFEKFRTAMANAKISQIPGPPDVSYMVEI